MEYLKPQSPIKIGENYIYPLTTSDQIINGDGKRIKNIADTNEICYLYSAKFSLDSWIGEGPYTQAATLTAVDGGGQVTAQSTLLACVGIDSTLPQETKDAMQSAASDIVNAEKTLGTNTISVSLTKKPDVEVELYFLIKEGNGTNVPPLDPVGTGGGMKLLWTNPSPSASFAAQTVNIDLSGYLGVVCVFCVSTSGGANTSVFGPMNIQTVALMRIGQISLTDRSFTPTETGVQFTIANDHQGGTRADWLIPVRIYGIKL